MPRNATRKLDVPEVFPGEAGFALLVANDTFRCIGKATKCYYRFTAGREQYVDKRDMPGLPREKFNK